MIPEHVIKRNSAAGQEYNTPFISCHKAVERGPITFQLMDAPIESQFSTPQKRQYNCRIRATTERGEEEMMLTLSGMMFNKLSQTGARVGATVTATKFPTGQGHSANFALAGQSVQTVQQPTVPVQAQAQPAQPAQQQPLPAMKFPSSAGQGNARQQATTPARYTMTAQELSLFQELIQTAKTNPDAKAWLEDCVRQVGKFYSFLEANSLTTDDARLEWLHIQFQEIVRRGAQQ